MLGAPQRMKTAGGLTQRASVWPDFGRALSDGCGRAFSDRYQELALTATPCD